MWRRRTKIGYEKERRGMRKNREKGEDSRVNGMRKREETGKGRVQKDEEGGKEVMTKRRGEVGESENDELYRRGY